MRTDNSWNILDQIDMSELCNNIDNIAKEKWEWWQQ